MSSWSQWPCMSKRYCFRAAPSSLSSSFILFTTSSAWRKWFKDIVNKKRSGDLKLGKYLAFLYYKNVILCLAESTSSMTKWPYDKISMDQPGQFTKNIKDYIQRHFRYCWCHSHWWARVQDLGAIISKETFQVPHSQCCPTSVSHPSSASLSPLRCDHTVRRPVGIVYQSHGDWRTASEIQDLGLAWHRFLLFLFAINVIY